MKDITHYQQEKFDSNDPDSLDRMYENLKQDINYMHYMMKQFSKEVSGLMSEISYLNEDIHIDKKTLEHYNMCKKEYIQLYDRFDDIRNYYDGSRN